jgi:hypothetical protein
MINSSIVFRNLATLLPWLCYSWNETFLQYFHRRQVFLECALQSADYPDTHSVPGLPDIINHTFKIKIIWHCHCAIRVGEQGNGNIWTMVKCVGSTQRLLELHKYEKTILPGNLGIYSCSRTLLGFLFLLLIIWAAWANKLGDTHTGKI